MDRTLTGLIRALRASGADVSSAEAIDAGRAMALVGYADRANLKATLAVTLAKSEEEKQLFDRVFDLFFSVPPVTEGAACSATDPAHLRTGDAAVDALLALLPDDMYPFGQASDQASPAFPGHERLRLAMSAVAQNAGVDDIQFASQTSYYTRRMLEGLGIAALETRLQALMGQDSAPAQHETRVLSDARERLQHHARAYVDQRFVLFGQPATEAFLTEVAVNRPLGRMSPPDIARMKAAVARMARRLAARHARRHRIVLRGQLDLRRTLRANAGHDGVPFDLVFKHRRRDKPRIVVVCDVSGSVATHVRFLLLFLYALKEAVADVRVFAFSHHLRDVALPLDTLPFDDAMALILHEVGSGSTDYGQAWVDLHAQHWKAIDGRTTVLVMGDGRSNRTEQRLDIFAELAERAKRVVWLCPEPPRRWGSGDSEMLRYRPHCTHVSHCASATDLERAMDEALAVYG